MWNSLWHQIYRRKGNITYGFAKKKKIDINPTEYLSYTYKLMKPWRGGRGAVLYVLVVHYRCLPKINYVSILTCLRWVFVRLSSRRLCIPEPRLWFVDTMINPAPEVYADFPKSIRYRRLWFLYIQINSKPLD